MNGHHRTTPIVVRSRSPRPPVTYVAIHLHPCASCGALTGWTWFCVDCRDRAQPHIEGDPYDELGGDES
jgi:hypothetical protein